MYQTQEMMIAFLFTAIAGLSTGVGSLIAFFSKRTNLRFLSVSLGFSAGVMIYVSMIEIFAKAQRALIGALGAKAGTLATVSAFFGGMLLIKLIDNAIPREQNLYQMRGGIEGVQGAEKFMRTGTFTAIAIAIHNFPEGLATFVAALNEPTVAMPIVVAIAIHNIPEGIAVSYPIYYATGSRVKAFLYSLGSGLTEPIGALVGYMILMPLMSEAVFGVLFGLVAGMMVLISLDELLPSAQQCGSHSLSMYGLVAGMAVMAASLFLFMV